MSQPRSRITSAFLCFLLAACGGGGSDNPSSAANGGSIGASQASDTTATLPSDTPAPVQPGGNELPADASSSTPSATPDNPYCDANDEQPPPSNPQLAAARFYRPNGITFDAAGNLYVIDRRNIPDGIDSRGHDIIRKITPDGAISNLGGGGYEFDGLAVDPDGNVYYAETRYDWLKKLSATGTESIFASSRGGGIPIETSTFRPLALDSDAHGNLYIADTNNQLIRKITPEGVATIVAGQISPDQVIKQAIDGDLAHARFANPVGIAVDAAGDLYVLDRLNGTYYDSDRGESIGGLTVVRKISVATGTVTTIAGLPQSWGQSDSQGIHGSWGPADAAGVPPRFSRAGGIAVDTAGNIYVTDNSFITNGSHSAIRKITPDGTVSTITNGQPGNPFGSLKDITIAANDDLYVTDEARFVIYKVTQGGQVTVFAGKEDEHGRVAGFGN